MTVTIRRAVPGDEAAVAAVAAATFPLACPPHTTDAAKEAFIASVLSEQRFAGYLADESRRVLLAEDAAGAVIGYTMVNLGEPEDADVRGAIRIRPSAELSKCYVLPGHQGAGVAGQLMAESLRVAAETGARGCGWASTRRTAVPSASTVSTDSSRSAPSASWSATATRTTG